MSKNLYRSILITGGGGGGGGDASASGGAGGGSRWHTACAFEIAFRRDITQRI